MTMGNPRLPGGWRCVIGGVLAGLAPNAGGPLLMVPALALLWSVLESRRACAVWAGLAVLVSHCWLLALHPLTWMGVPGPLSLPVAVLLWLACAVLAAGLAVIWSTLAQQLPQRWPPVVRVLLLAVVWAVAELLLSGSPLFWIGVGGSTLPWDRPLAGLARWFGSGGLALMQLGWGWCLLVVVQHRRFDRGCWLGGLVSLLLAHGLGAALLNAPPIDSGAVDLALWQPAVPTREKFDPQRQKRVVEELLAAMAIANDSNVEALIAPEGALPSSFRLPLQAPSLPLISGGFRWVRGQQRSSILLFSEPGQQPVPLLDKHRLVPIGEWMPPLPAGLSAGLSAVGGLQPGPASRNLAQLDPPAAAAICYEIADGTALAKASARGATWLLTIANLDPYPPQLQEQFLALAQLRAIETGRDLLSVANTGPSALISATGHVQRLLPFGEAGVARARVQIHERVTLYSRLVD